MDQPPKGKPNGTGKRSCQLVGVMQGCCWVADSIVPIVSNAFNVFKTLVHGHGRDKRLGTCLMLEPHASGVVSLQHVSMFQYVGCARAWTGQAPWYVPCALARCIGCCEFVACVNVSLSWLCIGMDEACTSVLALCFSRMHPVS